MSLAIRRMPAGLCLLAAVAAAPSAGCKRGAAPVPLAPSVPRPATDVAPAMDAVVTDFRGIVALLAGDPEPGDRQTTVAWLLAEANRDRLDALAARMAADPTAAAAFLDKLEGDAALHDADKLAFRDQLMELPPSPRADQDRATLATIEARYDAEMKRLFGRLPTRGLPDRREAWETYLDFVRHQVSTEALLAAHAAELEALAQGGRGGGALPWRDDKDQVTGLRFGDKQVLLTFDDGPSARLTPQVREILARFGVRAVFFEVGRNVAKAADEPRRILASGYAVANHSFTHAFLPKLDPARLDHELGDTNKALEAATKEKTVLFRPPYGARNDAVLKAATALGMKTVLWNVDSMDWADPVPLSIADRVVAQVEKKKRGIILFHDIHERTLEALPLVLGELQKRGYTFLSWDGRDFVAARGGAPAPAAVAGAPGSALTTAAETPNPLAGVHLYRESWAVVVGINAYQSWPRLAYAVNDAQAVREILVRKYGFPADHVTTLLDGEATREKILAALGDNLADGRKVTKDDRVFVFFAGHGVTRKLPSGKSQGFIVPVDAAAESFQSTAISMTNLQDASDAIPAKHVFFVMDACYSGLALTRGGAAGGGDRSQYLMEITRRQAREVLTAGGGDEQVADNGPGGHSIFTWTLLQGLEGKADLDGDGAITATELAAYVAPGVSSLSRQTPAFGHLAGDEGGDLVFVLKPEDEFLSEESRQLDAEAIVLNTELEKVRHEVAAKKARNEELRRELAQSGATAGAPDAGGAASVAATPALAAAATAAEASNDEVRREVARGMSLYREKRYDEAARAFEGVLRLRPGHVMATNNLAFTYFKLGRTADAIVWYEKTIALDPKRAIAYANLGDALAQAGRPADAKRAYQQFLALQPGSKLADGVQKKLALLPPGDGTPSPAR
ncbi:MAG TPA: polysaccharide deacetylase family protein [Polyangia bacterium]|nr:polysaccharide deacetylase family protein [Polyangia bacterium]